MEIKIYIDLLFFTNFYFDAFLLWLTCLLLRRRPKPTHLLLAATFGGLYSTLLFFAPKSLFFSLPGKLLSGAVMLLICAPSHCLRAFLKQLAVFFSLSLSSGGIVSVLLAETGIGTLLGTAHHNGIRYLNLPFFSLPLLLILGYLITRKTLHFGTVSNDESIYTLEIHLGGKSVTTIGFYDSGNMMKTADGRGVMVTDFAAVSPLFKGISAEDLPLSIPCQTLQGKSRLPAFLPDEIYIKKGLAKKQIKPFCIAISPVPIHHYWNAILPRDFKAEIKEMTPYETPIFTKNV